MPVDTAKKFLYIHIPKTAGTYIETVLGLFKKFPLWSHGDRLWNRTVQHYPLYLIIDMIYKKNIKEYQGYAIGMNINLRQYYIFTTVRHPYDRFLSAYNQYPDRCNQAFKDIIQKRSAKDFAKYLLKRINKEGYNFMKYGSYHQFEPMYLFIKQKYTNYKVHIFKTDDEKFTENVKNLCQKFKIVPKNLTKFINKGTYKKQLDDELKELIYKIYKMDFDYFKYEK